MQERYYLDAPLQVDIQGELMGALHSSACAWLQDILDII
jgi:hypothetical protein